MSTLIRPDMTAARPDWAMPPERDVTVHGHRIRYWEKGAGRPLVLMHGFSGSATFEWGRVIDALAAHHRVIVPQCIGFAPSEQPDLVYSTDTLVRHLGGFFACECIPQRSSFVRHCRKRLRSGTAGRDHCAGN